MKSDDSATRDEVLEFLDFEIGRLHARVKANDWPRWGIVLSCGGIAWALLGLLSSTQWTMAGSARAVLLGAGAWKVLAAIRGAIESLGSRPDDFPRFRWVDQFLEGPKLWLVLRTGVAAGYVVLAVVVWPSASWIGKWVPIGLAAAELLGVVVVMGMIQLKSSFPVFSGMGAAKPFKGAALASIVLGATLVLTTLQPVVDGPPEDTRTGALILVLVFLLLRYADQLMGNPLTDALEELRRQVALHKVPPDQGLRQAEAILDGVPLEGLFGKELATVVASEQTYRVAVQGVELALAPAQALVGQHEEAAVVEASLAAVRQAKVRFDDANAELKRARMVLQRKHVIAASFLPAFGVRLPPSVILPVLEGLSSNEPGWDVELETLMCERELQTLLHPEASPVPPAGSAQG